MNETTVRGNIITAPSSRRVGDDPVFSFRVASNTRYQDRESGEWKNGSTLYFTATCWGRLAEKAAGRLVKGDAVILSGRLLTNEYERDGVLRRDLEMRVTALGADMARMDVTVRRPKTEEVPPPATGIDEQADQVGSTDLDEGEGPGTDSDTDPDTGSDATPEQVGVFAGAGRP